ncbi:MAG: 2-succinyl-5-enolpyruvyl-6-hydroxy-3-cyclohexene-1-carboxylic-acid synthase, partial [Deltaproteobacteria bacterium]|nr:2-succinyl-5-enolpyruvyl-6-hydroxy-3-cyclohexene-1-carboxylic-acid synthase [Deltaproteobacteria bacterium]
MSAPPSRALFAARCLVGELARAGLREACLAPGSRSTPLALALAESAAIRTRVFTDERSLAFFALGVAKAASAPVAIVCTSGTAAANLLPAVVEASLGAAALLVLTADRPPELRDCSAPQTIDQVGIYGSHVRWAFDVPILDIGEPAERYYRALAMRALAAACAHNSGPVHLNLPFREPFWDDSFTGDPRAAVTRAAAAATDQRPADAAGRSSAGASAETPAQAAQGFAGVSCSPSRLDEREARALAERIAGAQRGLIVCAGQPLPAGDIAALAAALDWPILADPLSGLRYGGHDRSLVVDAYDVLLRDETFCSGHRPDVIVRFGSTPAPRSLQMFLTQSWPCDHLLVAPSGWPDPFHACSGIVRSEPGRLCRDLTATLARTATRSDWTACWLRASRAARSALDASLDAVVESAGETFEGAVVRAVARVTADAGGERPALFVGNSMPIRDVDAFFGQSERPLSVLANRGASGIDGVLSTALGVAATREQPTVLVLGDLSFLHDVTALAVAARLRIPLVTVVINNNGGGIFSFLAQQGLEAVFEPLFATPHDVDLAATAAALLPGGYELAADTVQLA